MRDVRRNDLIRARNNVALQRMELDRLCADDGRLASPLSAARHHLREAVSEIDAALNQPREAVCACGHAQAEHTVYASRGCLADAGAAGDPNPRGCRCESFTPLKDPRDGTESADA